jgi:hypothetical protein
MQTIQRAMSLATLTILCLVASCAWRPYAGDVRPSIEEQQGQNMTVADDGTITWVQDRLEVRMRPVTDEELNRQFGGDDLGPRSENPFTYGGVEDFYTSDKKQRFAVFLLGIKNYQYPKVRVVGDIVMVSSNERKYYDLNMSQLDRYFRAYALGYRGNEYNVYKERRAILQSSRFRREDIFSGQELEGYVLFEPFHSDVSKMTVMVKDLVIRFDYRGEPVEAVDIPFNFEREVGREFPDGTVELSER